MPLHLAVTACDVPTGEYDVIAIPFVATNGEFAPLASIRALTELIGVSVSLDADYATRHRFEAKAGQSIVLSKGPGRPTLLLVGMGERPTAEQWRAVGAQVVRLAQGTRALLLVEGSDTATEAAAIGGLLASYRFEIRAKASPQGLEHLELLGATPSSVEVAGAIAAAVSRARDFVNQVPSTMTPTRLADEAATFLAEAPRVSVEVWDERRIGDERLGGLLGVAKGSQEAPRLVKASYEPAVPSDTHVVLVGKGITFDSGGLSLKSANGMTTMKTDMTGAAVVLSLMSALAALNVAVRVTAIAPMAENMPSGSALKPGDVLIPRSGTTIEVLNTDAEGRLILADGLALAVEESPDLIVDVATLTGAAVVALGTGVGALLSNSDGAAQAFGEAAERSGEKLWRLPLVEEYESHITSEIADIKNTGAAGEAGTISAALFLQHFVDGRPWVHLDIAGPGRSEKNSGIYAKGGTAFSLMTILEYLRSAT